MFSLSPNILWVSAHCWFTQKFSRKQISKTNKQKPQQLWRCQKSNLGVGEGCAQTPEHTGTDMADSTRKAKARSYTAVHSRSSGTSAPPTWTGVSKDMKYHHVNLCLLTMGKEILTEFSAQTGITHLILSHNHWNPLSGFSRGPEVHRPYWLDFYLEHLLKPPLWIPTRYFGYCLKYLRDRIFKMTAWYSQDLWTVL